MLTKLMKMLTELMNRAIDWVNWNIIIPQILYPLAGMATERMEPCFMNFGYLPQSAVERDRLKSVEKMTIFPRTARAFVYLYEKCMSTCPLYPEFEDSRLLEVSCGQGASIAWITETYPRLRSINGVDQVIRTSLALDERVVQGTAQALPFPDSSFDLIINVEASHLYEDLCGRFMMECQRVLAPGGYLCWADLRELKDEPFDSARAAGLKLIYSEDISEGVIKGVAEAKAFYAQYIDRLPFYFRILRRIIQFQINPVGLQAGRVFYIVACWQKPATSQLQNGDETTMEQMTGTNQNDGTTMEQTIE